MRSCGLKQEMPLINVLLTNPRHELKFIYYLFTNLCIILAHNTQYLLYVQRIKSEI